MPISTPEECVKGMFLTAGATRKQAEHNVVGSFRVRGAPNLSNLYLVSTFVPFKYGWRLSPVRALSPLAVIAAEVLIDRCFQFKEVLLHCSPDGSLDYPGNHTQDAESGNTANTKLWTELCFQVFFEAFNFVKVLSFWMVAVCVWICV